MNFSKKKKKGKTINKKKKNGHSVEIQLRLKTFQNEKKKNVKQLIMILPKNLHPLRFLDTKLDI